MRGLWFCWRHRAGEHCDWSQRSGAYSAGMVEENTSTTETNKDIVLSTLAGFCDSFVDIYFRVSDCLATSKGYEEVLAYLHVWCKLPTSFEMDRNAAISCWAVFARSSQLWVLKSLESEVECFLSCETSPKRGTLQTWIGSLFQQRTISFLQLDCWAATHGKRSPNAVNATRWIT